VFILREKQKSFGPRLIQVRHQGKPGYSNRREKMTLPVEGKTKDLACEREREMGQGYRLRYYQQAPMTLDNFM
jgi:hypothetical protein